MLDAADQLKVELVAKTGAVTAGGAALTSWFAVGDVIHVASTVVALVAGSATAWYYVDKVLAARKLRKHLALQLEVLEEAMSPEELARFLLARQDKS